MARDLELIRVINELAFRYVQEKGRPLSAVALDTETLHQLLQDTTHISFVSGMSIPDQIGTDAGKLDLLIKYSARERYIKIL